METYYPEIAQAHPRMARERVLADLKILARDSEDLLIASANDASDRVKAARARVTQTLERISGLIGGIQGQALTAAQAATKGSGIIIRNHLPEFVGAAFGLGLLIGVLAAKGCHGQEDST
jgi:ElaB/YqjD/DUF883 family membrane-anchored ribosome-binding protein